jgi:prepilin-type N-terminal cleavage/methylation domain-containing protein
MPAKRHNSVRARRTAPIAMCHRSARGFTVTELMLAVAIMGVIIFALYSVFNQTQRAMRSTETQGDVAERARAIVDIITREIEQAHPTFSAVTTNKVLIQEVNMMGGYEFAPQYAPRMQKTDRTDVQARTNFFHNIFFYTHHTNAWQAIGYRVVYVTNGVGVLERFETNQFGSRPRTNVLSNAFKNESLTNVTYHHVADGVMHLAFIPYDSQGRRLGFDTTNRTPDQYTIFRTLDGLNPIERTSDVKSFPFANVLLQQGYPNARAETMQYATRFAFKSNALPSYIEMEFALLEPDTLSQYYLMMKDQNPNAENFLQRQMAKVHLFRQRIPIRTAAQ